jgi:hypothetical protein
MAGKDAIEMLESKAEDALAGAAVEAEHGKGVIGNFAGYFFEGSGVQSFLIAEVVIEEGLVYPCGGGNGAGSSTGEAMFAEFANGGVEDAVAGVVGVGGLSGARH